jgi:hypothetical protein
VGIVHFAEIFDDQNELAYVVRDALGDNGHVSGFASHGSASLSSVSRMLYSLAMAILRSVRIRPISL